VGGPDTYTYREIAELAFAVLGQPPRIRRVPVWLVRAALPLARLWGKRYYTIAAGIATIMRHDFVAPPCGTHSLKQFFEEMTGRLER
jgi:hypothetical protein